MSTPQTPSATEPSAIASSAPKGRWALWGVLDFVLPAVITVILGAWFTGELDLAIQSHCYVAEQGWVHGDEFPWGFLYDWGAMPAILVAVGSVVGLVLGFKFEGLAKWSRVFLFAVTILIVGPGLVTNTWLKDNWGRPRPREVTEFGGRYAYETILGRDDSSPGKSFPCGHATMGFFFFGGYFLLRRRRPGLAVGVLVFSLAFGTAIGVARVVQGGHFASDVVWAAGVVFLVSAGLFYLLGLHRGVLTNATTPLGLFPAKARKIPKPVLIGGGILTAGLIAGVLLATPYEERREYTAEKSVSGPEAEMKFTFGAVTGEIEILPGDRYHVVKEAYGHGMPSSDIGDRWKDETDDDGFYRPRFYQSLNGWFTEIRQTIKAQIPLANARYGKFELGPETGTVIQLPQPRNDQVLDLYGEHGTKVTFLLEPGAQVWIDQQKATPDGPEPYELVVDPSVASQVLQTPTKPDGDRVTTLSVEAVPAKIEFRAAAAPESAKN